MTNAFASNPSVPQDAASLSYDVPAALKIAFPTHVLEAAGLFRAQYSVWYGTLEAIATLPIDEWSAKGIKLDVLEFKNTQWEKLRARAEAALTQRLAEFRTFMDEQVATAEAAFAQAEAEQSAKLTAKGRWVLRHALNDGRRRVKAAQATLLMFDLLNTRADLLKAFSDTADAYFAAHETRAWLRKRGAKLEQLELDADEPEVEAAPAPAAAPAPDAFAALDFLSGHAHMKVTL